MTNSQSVSQLNTTDVDELINDLRVTPGVFMGLPGVTLSLPVELMTRALADAGIDFVSLLGREPSQFPHAHVPVTAALSDALNRNSLYRQVEPGCPDARNTYYLSLSANHQLHWYAQQGLSKPRPLGVLTHEQVSQLMKNFAFSVKRELEAKAA